ncbi:hypothetical protein QE152_g10125 [Popillia japonica]|uniref:Uncharacterized protein n=1 Tax=Popillia japonica TaxID=7064 RepID=A0AAW1LVR4_POPJA
MWNLYQSILEDLPKTNNSVEGRHRGFAERDGAMHPNIRKFINYIKTEQSLNEIRIEQYVNGRHRGFAERDGAMHPNIRKFINYIKTEQSLNEIRIEQYVNGFESK